MEGESREGIRPTAEDLHRLADMLEDIIGPNDEPDPDGGKEHRERLDELRRARARVWREHRDDQVRQALRECARREEALKETAEYVERSGESF